MKVLDLMAACNVATEQVATEQVSTEQVSAEQVSAEKGKIGLRLSCPVTTNTHPREVNVEILCVAVYMSINRDGERSAG